MDAIILAGGFAKRMWPLTKNKPKQLLDLAGKPMLDYVFDSLDNLCLIIDLIVLVGSLIKLP